MEKNSFKSWLYNKLHLAKTTAAAIVTQKQPPITTNELHVSIATIEEKRFIRQLIYYPRTTSGELSVKPRIANYSHM